MISKVPSPRAVVIAVLDRIRQSNVRIVSLFLSVCWAIYVDEPGRQIKSLDERTVVEWMTALALFVSPSAMMRTPHCWRRLTHFVIAANWLAWACLITWFERYSAAAIAGQWAMAIFAAAALIQSLVTDDERHSK